jgi:hypothetical protein
MAQIPKLETIADAEYKCRRCGAVFVKTFTGGVTDGYATNDERLDVEKRLVSPPKIGHIGHIPPNVTLHECGDANSNGIADLIGLVNMRTFELYKRGRGVISKLKES